MATPTPLVLGAYPAPGLPSSPVSRGTHSGSSPEVPSWDPGSLRADPHAGYQPYIGRSHWSGPHSFRRTAARRNGRTGGIFVVATTDLDVIGDFGKYFRVFEHTGRYSPGYAGLGQKVGSGEAWGGVVINSVCI